VGFWDKWVEVAQRLCLRGRKRFGDNVVLLWVIVLQESQLDSWLCLPDPYTCYSVGGVYHFLFHMFPRASSTHNDFIWNNSFL
jgi:hypothetical protein